MAISPRLAIRTFRNKRGGDRDAAAVAVAEDVDSDAVVVVVVVVVLHDFQCVLQRFQCSPVVPTGNNGHACFLGNDLAPELAAHVRNGPRRRTQPGHASIGIVIVVVVVSTIDAVDHGLRKARVLAQESVAGMNGVRPGVANGSQDSIRVQIGGRRATPQAIGLFAFSDVAGIGVVGSVDGYGGNPQAAAGSGHPNGNLAAVGNQDLSKQTRGR
mmetsp:Transcript_1765/g.3931  ORF Transcript_1765/g.3931 Transcript_1765/m.3931 type:complete len:214 (+) Transcript_1765:466-1107(+)